MKKYLLCVALLLSGCASSPQWDSAIQLRAIHAKYASNQCEPFAKELQAKMKADGYYSVRVTYTLTGNDPLPYSARHQIVSWINERGEAWCWDSVRPEPVWVGTTSDSLQQRILQFHAPHYVSISNIVVE